MRNEILTEDHKYWRALAFRLSAGIRVEGCDCTNKITKKILMSLPNIDVKETLNYLSAFGGWCDCEILEALYEISY